MLNPEEISWLKKSTNELNNLLHEISASAYHIDDIPDIVPEVKQYLAITLNSVSRATRITDALFGRIREAESELAKAAGAENIVHPQFDQFHVVAKATPPASVPTHQRPIPISGNEDPANVAQEYGLAVTNPQGDKELILMVDDEDAVLLLAKMMLTSAGYRVIAASKPLAALELYKRTHSYIGLVILDFAMPVMDGSELFDAMRLANPRLIAVLSSGFTDQSKLSRMLAKGLKGFIPKPYTPDRLLTQVRSLLDLEKRRQGQS